MTISLTTRRLHFAAMGGTGDAEPSTVPPKIDPKALSHTAIRHPLRVAEAATNSDFLWSGPVPETSTPTPHSDESTRREFFHGGRRKVGCVTPVMGLVLMVEGMRTRVVQKDLFGVASRCPVQSSRAMAARFGLACPVTGVVSVVSAGLLARARAAAGAVVSPGIVWTAVW